MSKAAVSRRGTPITVEKLHAELRRLSRRVGDLEDLRDLNAAIGRNQGKPGIPWEQVKKELEL